MGIGEKIKELRTASGMSQQAFADVLHVSRDLVSKWECGTRRPDYQAIEKIGEVFNVSADVIIDKKSFIFSELAECFPDNDAEEEELTGILNNFLRRQTAKSADVFLKRYYYQKTVPEISAEYGLSENHVRSILSKARKKLKKIMKEEKR